MESSHENSGSETVASSENISTPLITSLVSKTAILECTNMWIYYLQMLNGLCTAGLKLSHCLNTLAQMSGTSLNVASQCHMSWDELAKATLVATQTVKTHITASMQDMSIVDTHSEQELQQQKENNQQIVSDNLLTFINLQYQFSIASCEFLGSMATCPCCQTISGGIHDPDCGMAALQQCFARLYTNEQRSQTSSPQTYNSSLIDSPRQSTAHQNISLEGQRISPSLSENRIPSPFQGHETVRGPSPIQGFLDTIRGPNHFESVRGPFPNPGQLHTMKTQFPGPRGTRSPLNFPLFPLNGQRRWSEAAASEMADESTDGTMRRWSMPWDSGKSELQVWPPRLPMSKLAVPTSNSSQDRSRSATPDATCIHSITGSEGLVEAIQLLSSRPLRTSMQPSHPGPTIEDRLSRKIYHGYRGSISMQDPGEGPSGIPSQQYDIPTTYPQTSRKSSSSTDSSSCLSIHSRSTTSSDRCSEPGAGDSVRIHQHSYSMWSGTDYLPFIRVPESQEPQDESDVEEVSTEGSTQSIYPKPL